MPLFFFVGGCLLLSLSVAVFGGAFFLRPADVADTFAWKPPFEFVDTRALAPETMFLTLGTTRAEDALARALERGHIEDAYALVAYVEDLSAATRVGALLQIAERYAAAKDTRKATWCYQAAAHLATIAPSISDPARLDTYLQASAGLERLNANDAARWIVDQAYIIADASPVLPRDLRARRLAQIAEAYTALNAAKLAADARNKSRDAASASTESALATTRAPFDLPVGKLPPAPDVQAATQARVAVAQQLIQDIKDNPPKNAASVPADLIAELADALAQEDDARLAFYDQQIPAAKDVQVQAALWRDKIAWLTLKHRVARGAFGVKIVAAWEKDRANIAAELSDAWSEWFRLADAQAAGLPKDATQAGEDVIRTQLLVARWGWLTTIPEKDLRAALDDANLKLRDASIPGLRLDAFTRGGKTVYWLVPDDLYGQGEKALPR
jgi:hypothetical protein